MKRRREKTPKAAASGSKTTRGELVSSPSAYDSTLSRLGVMPVDGSRATASGVKGSKGKSDGRQKEKSGLSRLADLSINESSPQDKPQMMDFEDNIPDEIMVQIFKHVFRPGIAWESAKVCKRWHVLQAINLLQKRGSGSIRCMGLKKGDRSGRKNHCDGRAKTLKLKRVESEWRLSMHLLQSCKRHIHNLEIKNCTHVSERGYQLISAFASNLKSIRLEFCNSLDDASFDSILDKCPTLRSIHLTAVNVTLVNVVAKAPKLQDLHVHGCRKVTAKTLLTILHGLSNLRSLSLTAMGDPQQDLDVTKFESGPPLKLQHLHLENSHAITDHLLQLLAPRLVNLRKLDLTLCTSITDDGLQAVLLSCGASLTQIVMSRCRRITDKSIFTLAETAYKLHDVSLAGCSISDVGLKADQLACFKTLDLQSCSGISAFGLKGLPEKLHGKSYKVLSEKKNVTISG
ncbi:hypothetical protein AXG93_2899s1160 [Marchantia polymorpha subsp. ruderalis]|uniref:F-box/LRR-repeat protein 15-like leucin rich repeat domain-containing protein n=1 Tax=Marchantia polymorpha subsp. ruderalis TaxID=1480154 RepID=A0A176VBZ7_MARPO|nr:hypothetical protein AXG93_2899s1160 [Marchantia polymorpha subsp. ruderalis]